MPTLIVRLEEVTHLSAARQQFNLSPCEPEGEELHQRFAAADRAAAVAARCGAAVDAPWDD